MVDWREDHRKRWFPFFLLFLVNVVVLTGGAGKSAAGAMVKTTANTSKNVAGGSGQTAVAPETKAGPAAGGKITLNYRGADIDQVLQFFSLASGETIIKDPAVTGPVTIICPEPVTLADAWSILQALLSARGFTLIQEGKVRKIIPLEQAMQQAPVGVGRELSADGETVITQVVPLQYLNAQELAKELAPLFTRKESLVATSSGNALIITDFARHVAQVLAIIKTLEAQRTPSPSSGERGAAAEGGVGAGKSAELGGSSREIGLKVIPLRYADAVTLARELAPLLSRPQVSFPTQSPLLFNNVTRTRQNSRSTSSAGLPGGQFPTMPTGSGSGAQGNSASADISSAGIGLESTEGMVSLYQQLLALGSSSASGLTENQIIADAYTNSLVISGNSRVLNLMAELIAQLDVEIQESPSRQAVYPLQAADAQTVVNILNTLFSSTQTGRVRYEGAPEGVTLFPRGAADAFLANPQIRSRLERWSERTGITITGLTEGKETQGPASAGSASPRSRQVTAGNARFAADRNSNSVIISAPEAVLTDLLELVKEIDAAAATLSEDLLLVYPLQNAKASDLATTLNQLFGNTTTTRAATSFMPFSSLWGSQSGNTTRTTPVRRTSESTSPGTASSDGTGVRPSGGGNEDSRIVTGSASNAEGKASGQNNAAGGGAAESAGEGGLSETSAYPGLVGVTIKIVAENNTNSLLITAPPDLLPQIKAMVAKLDQAPPQVLIEAVIMEVSLDESNKLGIEWQWGESGTGRPTGGIDWGNLAGAALGFRYSVLTQGVRAELESMAASSQVHVLATPKVMSANNKKASLNFGYQFPYLTSSIQDPNGTVRNVYTYKDVGVKLEITPRICASGAIALDLSQEISNFADDLTVEGGKVISQRQTQTSVLVQDGQTMVIGGMMRDNNTELVRKVPLLGDIPFLGGLFRRKETVKQKTELLVFITPRIVRDAAAAQAVTEAEKEKQTISVPPPQPAPAISGK